MLEEERPSDRTRMELAKLPLVVSNDGNNSPILRRWMRLFEVECSCQLKGTQWAAMTEQMKRNCLLYTQLMQIQARNLKQ